MNSYVKTLGVISLAIAATSCGSDKQQDKPTNIAPTAAISMDRTEIAENEVLVISAANSRDPDGEVLTYSWSLSEEGGANIPLNGANNEELELLLSEFGNYHLKLKVTDDKGLANSTSEIIKVTPSADDYPKVVIEANTSTKIGELNLLSGKNTQGAHGQLVSYSWTMTSKPQDSEAKLIDTDKVESYFIADKVGEYKVQLTATNQLDQLSYSNEITLVANRITNNAAPVAIINTNLETYPINSRIKFDGSSSYDPDGDPIYYQWQWLEKPTDSQAELDSLTQSSAEFTADKVGNYRAKLVVRDEYAGSEKTIAVAVTNDNVPPVANAGNDISAPLESDIELDGSLSYDLNKQSLQYEWRLISRPANSLFDELLEPELQNSPKVTVNPDVSGTYTFGLRVFDGQAYSNMDSMIITVTQNQPPVAVLPGNMVVDSGDVVKISGADSYDPEQQELTYKWSFTDVPEGYEGTLFIQGDEVQFSPSSYGSYTVELIVSDGIVDSLPKRVVIERQEPEVRYTRSVSGRFVDNGGDPISNIRVGGILQAKTYSDENGDFVAHQSSSTVNGLAVLNFNNNGDILGYIRLEQYDEAKPNLELGDIELPIMQRRDITIETCSTFSGAEEFDILFFQHRGDYHSSITFVKPYSMTVKVNDLPKQILLPTNAKLELRVISLPYKITTMDDSEFLTTGYSRYFGNTMNPTTLKVCD